MIYFLLALFVRLFVCLSVSPPRASFSSFWSAITLRRYMHCQYNERNNLQVELNDAIQNVDFIHV